MKRLKYKTRGQSSPSGKSKIYFSCHPDDFELYFDEISDEILKIQNCAIWYDGNPEQDDDSDFYEALEGMNLFVIPITTRFLSEENRAKDREFQFAIDHHIPFLPLMQESGIEDVFNRICGSYQFLEKNDADSTGIPYEEKLNLFLRTVLIGDEMMEKVRKAFDAYIFLSYRKIDRKHARELMQLIHKIPEFRDIAMWYDEYLVPGENFDDSIMEALSRSDLFVMVVTPNLLRENNYIMAKEYPAAVQKNKTIIPVEMVDTDREKIKEYFPLIPPIADIDDPERLRHLLMENYEKLSVNGNNSSPEHLFFIGLAYLGGIDMEVDMEKGRKLLEKSAEAGFLPALSKLVSIYQNGEGVKRDSEKVLEYQIKLVKASKDIFDQEETEENYKVCFEAYMALGKMLLDKRSMERAAEIYRKALETADNRNDLNGKSRIYHSIGEIHLINGELNQAEEYFKKSMLIQQERNRELDTVQSRKDLAVSYQKLGEVLFEDRRITEAIDITEKCADLTKRIMEENKNTENSLAYAQACDDMCEILRSQGQFDKAIEWLTKGKLIKEETFKEDDSMLVLDELADSYSQMGNIYRSLKKKEQYIESVRKGLELRKKVFAETETMDTKFKLSKSYRGYASGIWKIGKIEESEESFHRAIELQKELCSVADTLEYRRELTFSYNNLGIMLKEQGRYPEAKALREEILKIREDMLKEVQSFIVYRDLAIAHNNLACLLRDEKDYEGALMHFGEGLKIRTDQIARPDSIRSRNGIALNYTELGVTRKMMGDLPKAKEYLEKAIEIREELLSGGDMPDVRADLEESRKQYREVMDLLKN